VPREEELPELDAGRGKSDNRTEPQQEPVAEPAAEYVPEVIADNRADRSRHHHEHDVQPVRRAGEDRSGDEGRFSWGRNAHTLERDNGRDDPVSVCRDQVGEYFRQRLFSAWRFVAEEFFRRILWRGPAQASESSRPAATSAKVLRRACES
jgi:hypothetical protein